ncbi:hypothetical protein NEMBOFW57_003627 [Staphylotrichum longicolle]|uniref:CHAT domain-containing protein n=1 Tax=Staphylotrichum longicolle TaxID=669026 RepID=A0AAD4F6E7_9PEZI|nr:hypothetical protein NEMBOFW57_003627 [Staphylotrichum longicolle]
MDMADALLAIDRALDFLPDDDPYATEASDLMHAPNNAPGLFHWHGKLAHYLQHLYNQTQDLDLLSESIAVCQKGLEMVPDGDGASRAALLETQADALQNRAKRNNSIEDVDAAVRLSFDAVAMIPESGKKSQYLTNLGCQLEDRFDRLNRVEDLQDAIRVSKSALPTPPGPANLLTNALKHNIGVKLLKLYNINKQDGTFDEGFSLLREAVETMQPSAAVPAHWLNSLAHAFRSRYWRNKETLDDLNTAIDHQTEATGRLPRDSPNWPGYASNMAWLLRERAERTRNQDDLQRALSFVQDAAASVPENHVHRSHIMFSLARLHTLAHTFSFGGMLEVEIDGVRWNPPWEDQSIPLYLESLDDPLGDPVSRMVSAVQLMAIFRDRGEYARAVEIGEQVLDILRKTNTRLLSRDDQQRLLADFSDIAVETCALSIRGGERAACALELLELGRGLILGLLMEDRSDVSGLAATHPKQAAEYEKLRNAISRPIEPDADVALRQTMVRQRDHQVRELDKLISEIRELPEHTRFLQGPSAEEVKALAVRGPVIVVNVADERSDAILVTPSDIKVVHLPALQKGDVQAWLDKKPTRFSTRGEFGKKNTMCREYLSWLWTVCVKPIMRALGLLDKPLPIKPSRVWWSGAGLAAFLPFHAAGDHRPSSTANAYTYLVSSYTPTIRTLAYSRQRASLFRNLAATPTKPSLLVALMPTTPPHDDKKHPPLRTATKELALITTALGPSHTIVSLTHPNTQTVLTNLPDCTIAHFACHGVSDPDDPSSSHLIFQQHLQVPPTIGSQDDGPSPESQEADPSAPSQNNPSPGPSQDNPPSPPPTAVADLLTVRHLAHHTTAHPAVSSTAQIAYLSACSTAESRAARLVDEVLHLASGFQAAGFPHVVATMWPAEEEASVAVAGGFYARLAGGVGHGGEDGGPGDGGGSGIGNTEEDGEEDGDVAGVLREAVMGVREKWPLQPLRWAGYVHFGV